MAQEELNEEEKETTTEQAADAPDLEELQRKAKVYDSLVAAQAKSQDLKNVYLDSKEEAEAAKGQEKKDKAAYDASLEVITAIIRAEEEELPLFPKGGSVAEGLAPTDDSWRKVPLSDLEISAAILSKLTDAGIETIGALADYTKDGRNQVTDIKGLGPAKATAIDEALDTFWAEWNRPSEFSVEEAEDDAEEGAEPDDAGEKEE